MSGAAPGSARMTPRFGGARRASRLRGARATGAAERSTTDPHHRAAAHRRTRPTAPRGDEPRRPPTGTTRSPTPEFAHADHTPTAARALMHARVAEHKAHLHRPLPGSDASQTRGRCQVQRRVRLAPHRGSWPRAERRASAEPVPPVRACGAPPTRRTVSRPTGGHPPPHLAAMSRARHPRAPRGAPPTRTAVSPRAPGHAHPHFAATSRANHRPAPRGATTV
ncbi:hypothetical protein GobsT_44640 [Gemmata obscuriglobus]|nr:hypothetical protein GobsT_44640 [Gemmata obscuriglobus]VTS08983.1 unnamed protein product [Gemmata obscuriglobus UQM 2246]